MKSLSKSEENHLKAIYTLCYDTDKPASTNAIASAVQSRAASVTDMMKTLAEKQLVHYQKYKGVRLTKEGTKLATNLVRKHRLWETFLVEKLDFSWDEVHTIAEELEHIKSPELIDRLDRFLGHPEFDPHGDPIPDAEGKITFRKQMLLFDLEPGKEGVIVGVDDDSKDFLQYLDKLGLVLGVRVKMLEKIAFDDSSRILLNEKELTLTQKVGRHLFVNISE